MFHPISEDRRSVFITLADRLTAANNRPTGFDYMRITLALLVVCCHTINVCYGEKINQLIWNSPARSVLALILPMFFALSGFLVAGSFERCRTLVSFAGLRIIRLLPALAVDTLIGALLLGPLFTDLHRSDYFSDPQFSSYFLNLIGEIHYYLPGVFAHNPWPNSVNLQLWTLPFELACYASISILAILGIAQRPRLMLFSVIGLNVLFIIYYVLIKGVKPISTVSGPILLLCFLFGITMYLFRQKIVWTHGFGLLSLFASLICLSIPLGDYLAPIPVTYLTVYLGLMQPRKNQFLTSGDYSYGIFLYGFPVQQAVAAVLGPTGQHWYLNLLVSLPIIAMLAGFSWWCIEKPALRLRPWLLKLEDQTIRFAEKIPGGKLIMPGLGIHH